VIHMLTICIQASPTGRLALILCALLSMRRWMRSLAQSAATAFTACAAYLSVPAQAADLPQQPVSVAPPPAPSSLWSFDLTPYAWLPTVGVKLNYPIPGGGTATANPSLSPSDYFKDIRFGVLLEGEVHYDRFSVLSDLVYLNLGMNGSSARLTSVNPGNGPINIPVGLQSSTSTGLGATVWSLAGGYTFTSGAWGNLDGIAGARLLAVNATTNYTLTADFVLPNHTIALARTGSLGLHTDIWEGIVGIKGRFLIPSSNFFVPFYADIGTGNAPLTWQVFGGVGYHTGVADLSLGYRYLGYQTNGNSAVRDLNLGGPIVTASFHF
jgi:hypothetical protein